MTYPVSTREGITHNHSPGQTLPLATHVERIAIIISESIHIASPVAGIVTKPCPIPRIRIGHHLLLQLIRAAHVEVLPDALCAFVLVEEVALQEHAAAAYEAVRIGEGWREFEFGRVWYCALLVEANGGYCVAVQR